MGMYTVIVRYAKGGTLTMNLKARDIAEAREKALHMESQAFYVEIQNAEGHAFTLKE
jgi:hypothetical protein